VVGMVVEDMSDEDDGRGGEADVDSVGWPGSDFPRFEKNSRRKTSGLRLSCLLDELMVV
jgi:hypothetical protein